MPKHLNPMMLRAHANVVDIAEARRARLAADLADEPARFHMLGGIVFVGIQSAPAETAPKPPRRPWWRRWSR